MRVGQCWVLGMGLAMGSAVGAVDYTQRGGWDTFKFEIGSRETPIEALDPWQPHVWSPKECVDQCQDSPMPVLVYVSGFAGGQAITSYESMFEHLASHGIVVVGVHHKKKNSFSISYPERAEQMNKVVAWIDSFLAGELRVRVSPNLPSLGEKIGGGHSAGNHVMVQHIVDFECSSFGGVVMNSPVDGADPFGINDGPEFFVTPEADSGKFVPVNIPALMIKGSLDPSEALAGVSCAPASMSNERFYKTWQGPSWFYVVDGVGHLDMCSDITGYEGTCTSSDNPALNSDFQILSAGKMAAFINYITKGEKSGEDFLNKLSGVVGQARYSGEKQNADEGATVGCDWNPIFPYLIEVIAGSVGGVLAIAGALIYCKFYRKDTGGDDDLMQLDGVAVQPAIKQEGQLYVNL